MTHIIVTGAAGKMGARIIHLASEMPDIQVIAAIESKGHSMIGKDAGEVAACGRLDLPITNSLDLARQKANVIIDFTEPGSTMNHLEEALRNKVPIVIGTTGFNEDQQMRLRTATQEIPCVQSPNMSVGVNLMFMVLAQIANITQDDYDVEILEMHHRFKKDAPSGTAVKMSQILAETLKRNLEEVAVYSRHGIIGERKEKEIGIQTLRGGDVVGDHTVIFAGIGERIEITHRAQSREPFARGALVAARWVSSKKPGLYDMQDVLGLR